MEDLKTFVVRIREHPRSQDVPVPPPDPGNLQKDSVYLNLREANKRRGACKLEIAGRMPNRVDDFRVNHRDKAAR